MENNLVLFFENTKSFLMYKQPSVNNIFNDFSHSTLIKSLSLVGCITNSVLNNLLNNPYRSKRISVEI